MFNGDDTVYCGDRTLRFTKSGKPINVELIDIPTATIVGLALSDVLALHEKFYKAIARWLVGCVRGSVHHVTEKGVRTKLPYVTVWTPPHNRLDINRGEWSRHNVCPECGCITALNFNDKWSAVESALDNRLAYLSNREYLILDQQLMDRLDLRKKFPDLRTRRVPVLEKPLDGDVLPGDPGWTGTFVPQDLKAWDAALRRKHARESAAWHASIAAAKKKASKKTKKVSRKTVPKPSAGTKRKH